MEKQKADKIITDYLNKIYGFAVKKSYSYDEAEDLCSDIILEVYSSLLKSDEIFNIEGYIWRISEHVYAKYVAGKKKHQGVSIDEMQIPYYDDYFADDPDEDALRMCREVAFLTQKRRQIVFQFYYEGKAIADIARSMDMPVGTVKWHLNKAKQELKEGFSMERKIGKLGLNPIEATGFGHSGDPGKNSGPEYYMGDKLNLNIVYSVYHSPKTKSEIAEELGGTLVYIEDKINFLEENGFLVKIKGDRYTTYVRFDPQEYSLELEDNKLKMQMEIADILCDEYVPLVRAAIADVEDVYIPGGNRELLEAAAVFYGVANKCQIKSEIDLSKYDIKTTAGGDFIASVHLESTPSDADYKSDISWPSYWACGSMTRWSGKYPAVYSWSMDTRYSSRQGYWENNYTSDYEYLYELVTGAINDNSANSEKFQRLRKREYITQDNKINIMMVKGKHKDFFSKIPELNKNIKDKFAESALELAMITAKSYPPQMQDLVVKWGVAGFIGTTVALMVMDKLYERGVFKPLTENERVTTNLFMFSDVLPNN